MINENVREYLKKYNREDDIIILESHIATVETASASLNVIPARIAKSIAAKGKDGQTIIIVTSGDSKIDNKKFKDEFNTKFKMLSPEDTYEITGFEIGGVCPFVSNEHIIIALDISIKRFDTVFPACGNIYSAIELSPLDFEKIIENYIWVAISKDWDRAI